MENSKIEWTDHTWNGWWGCTHVHAGCTHCYAETFSKRTGRAKWGVNGTRMLTSQSNWRQPVKWNKAAEKAGERARVFCASMADVFEDWQGEVRDFSGNRVLHCDGVFQPEGIPEFAEWQPATLDDVRANLFALIDATPWLDWLLLTKRPENVRRMWPHHAVDSKTGAMWESGWSNIWLGTSISDQPTADAAIPELLKCRDLAPVLFLSAEPLLGPVDLETEHYIHNIIGVDCHDGRTPTNRLGIDWVIVGGESGPGARPCAVEWIRSLRNQCEEAKVPCFIKQLGANARALSHPLNHPLVTLSRENDKCVLQDKKGGDWLEWPADLRLREFPITSTQ